MDFYKNYFETLCRKISCVDIDKLVKIAHLIISTSQKGKKVILVGNGGSAAMASHVSVDFTKAAKIRSVNFNESDLITCFANDYGYEQWVVEALKAYADGGDLVIFISSSGMSRNIINGAIYAKNNGLSTVALSGFDSNNSLRELAEIEIWADSKNYNHVEMTHHIWLLSIVDYIVKLKN